MPTRDHTAVHVGGKRQTKRGNPRRDVVLGPGSTFDGKYELLDLIGEGGLGRVFTALHLVLNQTKVIKILDRFGEHEEEARERFAREARIVAGLNHDNIVTVDDGGISKEGYPYLVMPFLEGESLKTWLERTPVEQRDLHTTLHTVIEVAEGLHEAHDHHIIHRDVKPGNIFLVSGKPYPTPKLLDFGVARYIKETTRLTIPGQSFGTEGYMSPEQFRGDDPDERSDIYALGAVLYEMLTGERIEPFERVVPPAERNPAVPKEVNRACMKALEPTPNKRFSTIIEFADSLCFENPVETEMNERKRAVPRVIIGASIAFFVLAAGMATYLTYPRNPDISDGAESMEAAAMAVAPPKMVSKTNKIPVEHSTKTANVPIKTDSQEQSEKEFAGTKPKRRVKSERISPVRPNAKEGPARQESEIDQARDEVSAGYGELERMNLQAAEGHFRDAISVNPKQARAWYGLGLIAREQRQYSLAVERIEKALQYSDRTKWRVTLGAVFARLDDLKSARREWCIVRQRNLDNRALMEIQGHLEHYGLRCDVE